MDARLLAAALLVLLAALAGIQLADPRLGAAPDPPPVDFSAPPNEVAADSAATFGGMDYAYRLSFRDDPDEAWRQVWEVHVDRSDREFYEVGPDGEDGMLLYGTESVGYFRPSAASGWRVSPRFTFSDVSVGQPFLTERIRGSNATIVTENSTFVVIAVDVHPLKTVSRLPGNARLYIEKPSGRLVLAEVTYNTDDDPQYFRFQLIESGIDVSRPSRLDYSPRGLFWDLLRGPLFRLFEP